MPSGLCLSLILPHSSGSFAAMRFMPNPKRTAAAIHSSTPDQITVANDGFADENLRSINRRENHASPTDSIAFDSRSLGPRGRSVDHHLRRRFPPHQHPNQLPTPPE